MQCKSRRDKLVALQEMVDLQTGKVNEAYFEYENTLYAKALRKKALDSRIRKCHKCPGLNVKRLTDSCPGWGDLNAKVFIIGQSLHSPGISTDLPFILGSGFILDAALRLSGLLRKDVFITNTIHCHPESNRGSLEEEKKNCLPFLIKEIEIVWPKLIVLLGNDAQGAKITLKEGIRVLKLKHPAAFLYSNPEGKVEWVLRLSKEIDKVL